MKTKIKHEEKQRKIRGNGKENMSVGKARILPFLEKPGIRRGLGIVMILAAFAVGMAAATYEFPSSEKETKQESVETVATAPSISASGAILINAEDGMVLYENGADDKMYPASTTKIMTALVVLETCEEIGVGLDSYVIVPQEAQGVEGSSLYLKAGEKVTLEELMYGMMLHSGNDAAVALASCIGGNLETFIDMMNEKAQELGCVNTHFVNPNGLFDENHYTTARDLAVISREAMKKEIFREIVSVKKWNNSENEETKGITKERSFVNKNKTVFQYEGGNGIKIGFTKASGRTLVASAKQGDIQLIAVVLRDSNWFQDAYALMDFGFELMKSKDDQ